MKKPTVDLPIEICGRIALPEQYEYLSEIWAKNIDDRPTLIKFKIANNDGMLKRNQIGYYDAAEKQCWSNHANLRFNECQVAFNWTVRIYLW
jgi:hypothetical protein